MPSDAKKVVDASKWSSVGKEIANHPNSTYHHPTRTEPNYDTGEYKAHPTYGNDKAARDRENAKVNGHDWAYSTDDPRHTDSKCHGPRINDQAARDRENNNVKCKDFGYPETSSRRANSKVGK
ncbi:hypothetical protein H2200_001302 [Cladophialophora chaetospira]|uniref:Uncharacterized protein n=1 Tax=Cladophialophora chaetospira TaxID=386627 RepID=A0AA38XKR6_9EURO|nr:hypothetical protein H2200_001302 [Cladophialophora chaetospira]